MRNFEHFPQASNNPCPICGTKEDRECFLLPMLLPMEGTQKGNIVQALPTHVHCMVENLGAFVYTKALGVEEIYLDVTEKRNKPRRPQREEDPE